MEVHKYSVTRNLIKSNPAQILPFGQLTVYLLKFISIKLNQESVVKLVNFGPLECKWTPTESHMFDQ